MSDIFERSRGVLKQYFELPTTFEKNLAKYFLKKMSFVPSKRFGCFSHGGVPLSSAKNEDGIPFASIDDSDTHTLVFGATGSKKSRLVAMPTVKILGQAKESMIIADPKAEIYERTASDLIKNGYQVFTVDLRNPNLGNGWNPLAIPLSLYKNGKEDMDRAYEFANDISVNLTRLGIARTKDPYWENSAASFFFGLIMLLFKMVEDQNIKSEHVTIGNLLRLREAICKNYSFGSAPTPLVAYAKSKPFINSLLIGTIDTADSTRAGILSTFDQNMRTFSIQPNLLKMLSDDDQVLDSLLDKPTAVFLIVPDEKTSYHSLVSLFIKQSYEYLIYKNQDAKSKEQEVKQRVNYILDEFSSLPTINDFPAMITAARSRNIRFVLFVQSKHQLDLRYGEESETIRANCNNWIFLVSREISLLNELSVLSGNRRLKDGVFTPVLTVTDLQRLDKFRGEALIFSERKKPYIASLLDINEYDGGKYEPYKQHAHTREDHTIDFSEIFSQQKSKDVIFDW